MLFCDYIEMCREFMGEDARQMMGFTRGEQSAFLWGLYTSGAAIYGMTEEAVRRAVMFGD